MVSSALLVAVPHETAAGDADKWTSELYAWDPVKGIWENGNLAGYHEGDLVGFKFEITHDTGPSTASPPIDSVFDHYNIGKNAYGIDAEILWAYNYAGWTAQFPNIDGGDLNISGNVRSVVPVINNAYYDTSGGVIKNYYEFEAGRFWIPAGETLYIYFQGHLATTAYYQSTLVDNPSTPANDPIYSKGASFFPGASLQVALSLLYTGTSAQTQSIPVTLADGSISGMKFYDGDSDGVKDPGEGGLSGWTIHLDGYATGNFPLHLTAITGSDGKYVFSNIPWGTYTISEEERTGWSQTYPGGDGTHVVIVGPTGLIINPNIDFGNSAPGKIRAEKLIDNDGDIWTTNDQTPGEGWTFELFYEISEGVWQSKGTKVTGADGHTPYWEQLMLGDYKMVETSKPGYSGIDEKLISLTTSNQEITMTFINQPQGTITVSKVIDMDGDLKTTEDQENGGAGWQFDLLFNNGVIWVSQGKKTTGESGSVSWTGLQLGEYKVVETPWLYWHNAPDTIVTLTSAGQTIPVVMYNSPPVPAIHIEKSGPTDAAIGEEITYTYEVTNPGEVPLSDVYVSDSVSGSTQYMSGDANSNHLLDMTETWYFTDTWVVEATPDPLVNVATAYGYYDGTWVQDEDSWSVDVLRTAIELTKTGPESAEIGETITYTLTVENTGDVDLYITSFTDSLLGDITESDYVSGDTNEDGILNPGEIWTFEVEYTVGAEDTDPLPNTAEVCAENQYGMDEVCDEDSWEVDLLYADIDLTKTGPESAEIGETITYTLTVENTGDVDLYITSFTDSLLGDITESDYVSGDTNEDGILNPGEIWTFEVEYTVGAEDTDPLPNTAEVCAENQYGMDEVCDEDSWEVDLLYADIDLTKTGPESAEIGETITYTLTVENTGDVDLYITSFTDSLLGDITESDYVSGDTNEDGILNPGEIWTFEVEYTVGAEDTDPLPNTAEVCAENQYGMDEVCDEDSWEVDLLYADIDLTKTGPESAEIGETITYTLTVENTGDVDLYITSFTDSLLGDITESDYVSGDTNEDGILNPGEIWTFEVEYTVGAEDTDPLPNTAEVCAENQYGMDEVCDEDSWEVDLLYADIDLTKTGPESAEIGETITYTLTVENTGDVDLYITSFTDSLLGDITESDYVSGDTNEDGILNPGEIWTFEVEYTVGAEDTDPLPNTAEVCAENQYGMDEVCDEDSWEVDLLYADIDLTKTGPESAEIGETITYTLTVENTGDVDLYITSFTDSLLGDITESDYVSGDTNEDGILNPGEIWTFEVEYTVGAEDTDPLPNTAEVCAENQYGMDEVCDEDSWEVDLLYADIDLTKTGPESAEIGETITYTLTVENTGDVDLYITSFTDSLLGDITESDYVSGDTNEDGILNPGEIWTFEVEYTVGAEDTDPLPNTAEVCAENQYGMDEVCDEDSWEVDLLYADIDLTKTGPESAEIGETITYTLTVENTGDVDLYITSFTDSLLGDITESDYVSGDTNEDGILNPGEIWTFEVEYTVGAEDTDPLPNTAEVCAENQYGMDEVCDEDSWEVDLLYADIDLTKTGPESAEIGETITYTLTVENTGDVDLYITSFTDSLLGDITESDYVSGDTNEDGILNPGEIWTFEVEYTVGAEDTDPLPNTAEVCAENQYGMDEVCDEDSWEVDLLYADIDLTKTGPESAEIGETITYTLTVENTGDVDLYITSFTDSLLGDITESDYVSGDTNEDGILNPGEIWTFEVEYTVGAEDTDPLPNTAEVCAENQYGMDEVCDEDSWEVDLLYADIDLTKTGPESAEIGETITYTLTVENTGDVDLYITSFTDSLLGDITESDYVSGDTNEDGILNPGEIWTFEVEYTVGAEDTDPLPNTAEVCAENQYGMDEVCDEDSWEVDLLYADIDLTKTGPESAEIGETITYTLTVENTGDVDLYITSFTDSLLGDITESDYVSGDTNEDGILNPGEIWTFEVEYTVGAEDTDPLPNTAEVCAENQYGMDEVCDEDSWEVDLLYASICVYKYEDLNLDGRYQEGEPTVAGVFIEIFDSEMELITSGYTNEEGKFCYDKLWRGTYYVQETVTTGWATVDDTLKEVVIDERGEQVSVTFLNAEKIDLSACKYEDVNGNGIVDEGDMPVENWRIDLFVWNDGWVLKESKMSGPCGCVIFEDLDPYCDYKISEEGMLDIEDGWIPAQGWETEVVFIHGVDFMSGQTFYGKGVVYGILRETGDVYEIDILAGTSILVFEMPSPPGANSASPNGLAYDAVNGRVYYTDYQLGTNPDTLYFWDGMMQHVAGKIAQGTVACADFYDGKYYYIPSGTDDLRAISFNPDGTILSDVKIADISGNVHSWTFNGDIAVRNGVLYGWGLCAVSGHGYEFFKYDLVTPAFSYIKPAYQNSLQLAFGSDDILYGHRAGTLGEFYVIDIETAAVTMVTPTPDPPNQYTDTASGVDVNRVTFLNFELVKITAEKLKDLTGDGPSEDDTPIEGWKVYLYQKIDEAWVLIDTQYTGADGTYTWTLGPGEYKVGEEEIIGWLPMTDTEQEFGEVTSGGVYSFTFRNFEVLPCINVTKSVEWDIEEYLSHTQGYWKNHLCAWVGIDPCAIFAIGGTAAVDFDAFPGGLTYIQVFKTSPKGDASIILAHQYLAAKLNDLKWGAPDVYDGFIADAEAFLLEHPVGSDPQGDDREYAINLAEILTDYNEGNHSGMVYPGLTLIYTVNVTNCGNVPLYNVHVYDSLLNTTFWLEDCGDHDGILGVGEWWEIVYTYEIPYEDHDCYGPFQWTWSYGDHHGCMGEGDWEWAWSYMHCNCEPEIPNMLCNTATAYGQAGPPEWDMWVQDSATVCLELWYYAATQGYWKNHPCAWVGISPSDEFFDSGMSWMELFWTPPAGDLIIVLAHQYMAAMLNDEMWGAPARYVDVIHDATDFLSEHSIGEDLTPEEKEMAHELAEALAEFNEGGVHP